MEFALVDRLLGHRGPSTPPKSQSADPKIETPEKANLVEVNVKANACT